MIDSTERLAEPAPDGIADDLLRLLRCPADGTVLAREGRDLVSPAGARYAVTDAGIPLFAEHFITPEARIQQLHYDTIATKYLANLSYPHTQAYTDYLDRVLVSAVAPGSLGTVAEICCGSGEAFSLFGPNIGLGVGVDVSLSMLQAGRHRHPEPRFHFVQGDATRLPLRDAAFDSVFMLGGIHHIGDRRALFSEIHRILKPGGRFYFREPLNDFLIWRGLRAVIYRLSPTLDHATERPLRWSETVPLLRDFGFDATLWQPAGLLGFCLFMNSDVLVVNRLFRFIPGITGFVRAFARLDEALLRLPLLRSAGLQVIGVASRVE
jgi:ubiquinone/menaquinone biosynthesis C-methylase UbiE